METKERVGESRKTVEEVYRPTGRPAKRPSQGTKGGKKPAPGKMKAAKPTDAQYKPYHKANQKKQARRTSQVKKFFSAQNPVIQSVKNLTDKGDTFNESSPLAILRRQRRDEDAAKKRRKENYFTTPAVVYTQPKAFNRDRLLVQLLTVLAVVLAIVMGLSVFFKVKVVTVSGAEVYSAWAVREASGIKEGDNLLTFGRAKACGQIMAKLPYVNQARIGIILPDKVNIEIEEADAVYAIKSADGTWWLMNSNGKVVDMANNASVKAYTQVLGVTLTDPEVNELGNATEDIPVASPDGEEVVPVTVTGKQRLNAALKILVALEDNDIVGEAASVDVTRLEDIILWYGTRYQVNLGSTEDMEYKIACMNDAILQMSDYQTGILDISFTTWQDQVGYTPFE